MNTNSFIKSLINILEENKADEIKVIDIKKFTDIIDYTIICTVTSQIHGVSLSEKIEKYVKEKKIKIIGIEGKKSTEWILIDLGTIVLHLMSQEIRDFYKIENLYKTES